MSLAALNSPPLVASLGVALSMYGQTVLETSPFFIQHHKWFNLIAYAINTVAVGIPGRIDGEVAKGIQAENAATAAGKKKDDDHDEVVASSSSSSAALLPRTGKTLVAPAGWAFAIWGPIFTGELAFVISQFFVAAKDNNKQLLASQIQSISAPFVIAQLFQTLWCAAFRPKYTGNLMWISTGMLGGVAYYLSKAHAVFTSVSRISGGLSWWEYAIHFLPISLHFGWTTAATLVNLNGAVAVADMGTSDALLSSKGSSTISNNNVLINVVGHASVVAATALGVAITFSRQAPVYGGVISWALFAVADGMRQRLASSSSNGNDDNNVGAQRQLILSTAGAYISGLASFAAGLMPYWK